MIVLTLIAAVRLIDCSSLPPTLFAYPLDHVPVLRGIGVEAQRNTPSLLLRLDSCYKVGTLFGLD
jgi:hypothetical protein